MSLLSLSWRNQRETQLKASRGLHVHLPQSAACRLSGTAGRGAGIPSFHPTAAPLHTDQTWSSSFPSNLSQSLVPGPPVSES